MFSRGSNRGIIHLSTKWGEVQTGTALHCAPYSTAGHTHPAIGDSRSELESGMSVPRCAGPRDIKPLSPFLSAQRLAVAPRPKAFTDYDNRRSSPKEKSEHHHLSTKRKHRQGRRPQAACWVASSKCLQSKERSLGWRARLARPLRSAAPVLASFTVTMNRRPSFKVSSIASPFRTTTAAEPMSARLPR